jgi:integrase
VFYFWSTVVPKLYRVSHPRTPWLVVFPDERGQRKRRHFKREADASKFLRDLQKRLAYEGQAGLVMDARARAEFFEARRLLQGAGHRNVSIVDAVREFVRVRPAQGAERVDAIEAMEVFLDARERENLAARSVESLRKRVRAFIDGTRLGFLDEASAEVVREWVYRVGVSPRTRINDRAALSAFFGWAGQRGLIADNPIDGVPKPRADDPAPLALSVDQAAALMRAAERFQGGKFVRYFAVALFAGLRPSEIEALEPDAWRPGADVIRVRGGKRRGRANRFAPVTENLRAWLEAYPRAAFFPGAFVSGFRRVRERARALEARRLRFQGMRAEKAQALALPWQGDICRHSFISYRLALVGDEVRVAREAGNSPEVIYRDYFQLRTKEEAERFFLVRPRGGVRVL